MACVWRCRFFIFAFSVPVCSAFGEDASEEFASRFDIRMSFAPLFGEFPVDGGFEDGGFVALEVGFDALEVRDGFVEAGELFFDFRDDALLFIRWCQRYFALLKISRRNSLLPDRPRHVMLGLGPKAL